MTVQPVLPLPILAVLAAVFVVARVAGWRRTTGPTRSLMSWRWSGLTAAGLLLFVAALRPALGDAEPTPLVAGDRAPNVFLVIDRSPSMSVSDDGAGTRMAAARADADALIDRYPDARVAVIEFAARPALVWPLSVDTWSLRPVLDAMAPQAATPRTVALTNAGAAGTMLRYQLISATQQYPRGRNLVFYLGSGATGAGVGQRDFDLSEDAVDGGAVLGYGTGADRSGEAALRRIADQIGVPYLPRSADAPLEQALPAPVPEDRPATVPPTAARTELYWAPMGVAAILILVELYLVLRPLRTQLNPGALR